MQHPMLDKLTYTCRPAILFTPWCIKIGGESPTFEERARNLFYSIRVDKNPLLSVRPITKPIVHEGRDQTVRILNKELN